MGLRGFDAYEVALGDEMRGERACLGKSVEDVEAELCIRAPIIAAIENCDLGGFPNQGVVAGYVRSYARYLGLDVEDTYRRFCLESGFRSPSSSGLVPERTSSPSRDISPMRSMAGGASQLASSRFAAPPVPQRLGPRVSLGALCSVLALAGLVAGLGYGGYSVLQDIQRVGFTPLPAAPEVVAKAPVFDAPVIEARVTVRPDPSAYLSGGALAGLAEPAALPRAELSRRDGPISAINPDTAGVFARMAQRAPRPVDSADDAIRLAEAGGSVVDAIAAPVEIDAGLVEVGDVVAATLESDPLAVHAEALGVVLHAAEEAWIRVRTGENAVVYEGTLGAGEQFSLPELVEAPFLKAGNAGGIFVLVDGIAYGPVGRRGEIARNVSLRAADIRSLLPQASAVEVAPDASAETHRRAEAGLPRP